MSDERLDFVSGGWTVEKKGEKWVVRMELQMVER